MKGTESKGNRSGSTLKCFFVLTMFYLHKSAACLAAYSSGEGVVLCFRRSLDGYACRCPVSSVGTVSTSVVALLARLYRQGSGSKSESFFRWSWALVFVGTCLTNRRRAGGAVSGLLTLLVRFGESRPQPLVTASLIPMSKVA